MGRLGREADDRGTGSIGADGPGRGGQGEGGRIGGTGRLALTVAAVCAWYVPAAPGQDTLPPLPPPARATESGMQTPPPPPVPIAPAADPAVSAPVPSPTGPRIIVPPPATPRTPPTGPAPLLSPERPGPRIGRDQPDASGFIPDRPPGPPKARDNDEVARDVESLIETVRDAEAEIVVVVGRSKLIETRRPLTRILVANPAVADVELIAEEGDSRTINLYGRAFGTTNLTLWDADRHPTTFLVRVTVDTRDLESRFKTIFPGADVRIRQAGSQLILEGQVPDARTMSEILQLLAAELRLEVNNALQSSGPAAAGVGGGGMNAGGGGMTSVGGMGGGTQGPGGGGQTGGGSPGPPGTAAGPGTNLANLPIINRVRVPGPRQVLLRVKIAELNRTAIRQLGVNLLDAGHGKILGSTIGNVGGINSTVGAGLVPGSNLSRNGLAATANLNTGLGATPPQLFGIFRAGEFNVLLNALRENDLAKILAEPNLVALDGQPARFLSGGQYPYPVPQNNNGGSVITIQFAQFGAILEFLPHIMADDVIRLDVQPNFSQLDNAAGVSVAGTTVPAINQRSARTVVEMREGQTLAIAGLLQTNTAASTVRIPYLGDLPIVGNLFSKNSISTTETELIVLVTPELIAPIEAKDVPISAAERVLQPTDAEFYLLGRIEGRVGVDERATIRELDPLKIQKHRLSEQTWVVGPHGHAD